MVYYYYYIIIIIIVVLSLTALPDQNKVETKRQGYNNNMNALLLR